MKESQCSRCKKWKPLCDFRPYKDGFKRTCLSCETQLGRVPASGKKCPCGTILRSTNPGPLCTPCEDKHLERQRYVASLRATEDVVQRALRVCATYCNPDEYKTPQAYLEALTTDLDRLCRAMKFDLPEVIDVWGVERSVGVGTSVCGEVHEAPASTEHLEVAS